MNKLTKKLMICSGAALVSGIAVTAAAYSITDKLVKIALDRETPKSSEKSRNLIAGSKSPEHHIRKFIEASGKLLAAELETMEISAYDGEKLIAHYYPCDKAKRIIIAMHGWRSTWDKDFAVVAEFMHQNGCSILFPEQRCHGNSGGKYMGFGMIERHDCASWAHHINELSKGQLPIYLAGVSMGASTVLMASELELPESVRGIIADCGYTSPHAIWKHVAEKNLHFSYDFVSTFVNGMCKKRINLKANSHSTLEALKKNTLPVLFIHGTDDSFVPIEMTYENYKACNAPKRLLVVPGAGHGMSSAADTELYENTLKKFWSDFDFK